MSAMDIILLLVAGAIICWAEPRMNQMSKSTCISQRVAVLVLAGSALLVAVSVLWLPDTLIYGLVGVAIGAALWLVFDRRTCQPVLCSRPPRHT